MKTEISFEICARNENIREERVPIQLQLNYKSGSGRKLLSVNTKLEPTTMDETKVEQGYKFKLIRVLLSK